MDDALSELGKHRQPIGDSVSDSLRIGSYVLDNDFRHPAVVAREAASLDLLSEGRLELGLGFGWVESDYSQTGIPFDPRGVVPQPPVEKCAEDVAWWNIFNLPFSPLHLTRRSLAVMAT
jgi:hypothetical protein